MVLGPAETLRPLTVRCGVRVDVLGDVGAADETYGLDVGVGEDRVDCFLVTLDHLEHPWRQAGLEEQLGQSQRYRGVALGRFEDEGVTAGQRRSGLPQRDHRREVERGDAGDHAEWLADRVDVDAGAGAFGELPLHQMRYAGGELDDLDAALDVSERIADGLAVLDRQQFGDLVGIGVDQFDELHQHPGAFLRVPRAPLLLRLHRHGDGGVDVGR